MALGNVSARAHKRELSGMDKSIREIRQHLERFVGDVPYGRETTLGTE